MNSSISFVSYDSEHDKGIGIEGPMLEKRKALGKKTKMALMSHQWSLSVDKKLVEEQKISETL